MRIEPIGKATWRVRPSVGAPPLDSDGLGATLQQRSFAGDAPLGSRRRRRRHPDDAPQYRDTIDLRDSTGSRADRDIREGRVLPEMTVEQFDALLRSDHGAPLLDPAHRFGQVYGQGQADGPPLVIDLTDAPSTIDLRA